MNRLIGFIVFLAAYLAFAIQPMIAKFLLPAFGGASAVWTSCMLFFQVLLLAGYSYAHVLSKFALRTQVKAHCLVLLSAAAYILTFGIRSPLFSAPIFAFQALNIFTYLSINIGPGYFALAATAPLLQSWVSKSWGDTHTYRLYSVSNMGAFFALLSYPVLIEPVLRSSQQATGWVTLFGAFTGLMLFLLRIPEAAVSPDPEQNLAEQGHRFLWVALPACSCVVLLAITNFICQDIATIPFLWVVPLGIYLGSFILCFDSRDWYQRRWYVPGLAIMALLICDWQITGAQAPTALALGVSLITLFVACMVCHGELVTLKPRSSVRLTEFYLCLATGGALGGILVGVVAPLVFSATYELQMSLAATVLFGAYFVQQTLKYRWLAWLCALLVVGALARNALLLRLGAVEQTRSFYGVLRVVDEEPDDPLRHDRALYHGRILHGVQFTNAERSRWATTYYGQNSGVGLLFSERGSDSGKSLGMVGLGAGTLATYGQAGDRITFYEINPAVEIQARKHFSFLNETSAQVETILGDARLSLSMAGPHSFDMLVLDAFSGDAIPVHLLTKEAMQLYLEKLKSNFALAIHISNAHLDLAPVVAGLSKEFSVPFIIIENDRDPGRRVTASTWALLSRDASLLERVKKRAETSAQVLRTPDKSILWTDDFSNLYSVFRR